VPAVPEKLPIVYVRGYAGGTRGIDKQVDDPFYGFNDGSTHVRVNGDGDPRFYQFESPLLRLLTDEDYELFVHGDQGAYLKAREDESVAQNSIWVYRFYDASATTFGKEPVDFNIERAATGLYDFVQLVRKKTGAPKVYLLAHSMGGLVCRCMLQKISFEKDKSGNDRTPGKEIVDRLFTFATPHGGISFQAGSGLIDWAMETFGPNGADIFSPSKMYGYLTPQAKWGDKAPDGWRPHEIPKKAFDVKRVFCLIGTDSKDYGVASKIVGPKSDGLVMINNAYVRNAHRAFVHRSHSGRYGVVNSEEAYQNLRRFLFGRLEVRVELCNLDLPRSKPDVKQVWQADVKLSVRGLPIVMHEQLASHYCPIQLNQELEQPRDTPDAPVPLTTVFLLDRKRFDRDIRDELPRRCRYSLQLRAFRLEEKRGFFFWQDHLEQTADWDDTLIVDVGQADDDPDDAFRAWAAWNSKTPGANADLDPITNQPLAMQQNVLTLDVPDTAKPILGRRACLRFSVNERG
jgi:pimeloyl-ACP methyl ester carboxylesterase